MQWPKDVRPRTLHNRRAKFISIMLFIEYGEFCFTAPCFLHPPSSVDDLGQFILLDFVPFRGCEDEPTCAGCDEPSCRLGTRAK